MELKIPSCRYGKRERIEKLLKEFELWINSESLVELVKLFGGKIPEGNFAEKIDYLNQFADLWDYRGRLSGRKLLNERWNVSDDSFVSEHQEVILIHCENLGLVKARQPLFVPDYILPLGGARYTNYDRPLRAKEVIDHMSGYQGKIVALSGNRPINEIERTAVDSYAPGAKTEYEAMNRGLEKVFQLDSQYSEQREEHVNINLCSCVRLYQKEYEGTTVYSIAAPSTQAERRANSRDTFEYFLEKFHVNEGRKLLLVTTQIYVPYQLLKFADLAIEKDFDVDCVGVEMDVNLRYSKASNYLQELKGTINVIYELYGKYI